MADILSPAKKITLNAFTDARTKITKIAGTKLDNAEKLIDDLKAQSKNIASRIKSLDAVQKGIDAVHIDYMAKADEAAKDFGIAPNAIPDFKRTNDWYFYIDSEIKRAQAELKRYI